MNTIGLLSKQKNNPKYSLLRLTIGSYIVNRGVIVSDSLPLSPVPLLAYRQAQTVALHCQLPPYVVAAHTYTIVSSGRDACRFGEVSAVVSSAV